MDIHEGLDIRVKDEGIFYLKEKHNRRALRKKLAFTPSHSWRRNERGAYKSRKPKFVNEKEIREKKKSSGRFEGREQQIIFPGTNNYLQGELDMSNEKVNTAVYRYGKMTVKAAARIAYDYAKRNGLVNNKVRNEILYLFEAIDLLGQKTVRDLIIRTKKDPSHLLTDFDINEIGGVNVLTPRKKVPLEVLAKSNTSISVLYFREYTNTVMFEYATK